MTENESAISLPSIDPIELGRVAVLYGGVSAEREISLQTGLAVERGLKAAGVDVFLLDIGDDPRAQIDATPMDRAFIALHGVGGEDGSIQALLGSKNIPYTGSGVAASALAIDKCRSKQMWSAMGLPTAQFRILRPTTDWQSVLDELGGKVMVKPSREGSSLGMSIANTGKELEAAYRLASTHDMSVFAETWLPGREFTVGVVGEQILPVVELRPEEAFYSYQAKYVSGNTGYLCPAPVDADLYKALQDISFSAFESIGCRGWGRVDVMLDASNEVQVLEVNTSPGMTSQSLVPMAAKQAGISFGYVLLAILSAKGEVGV